ncbi:hypothetical protein [Bacillus atrophaeus]|uniref:hypothetical protein n=1 Tax=Bacillus atrophaeus TaxID=1452 RepID=UPI000557AE8F|nr:hypothetical protein [Bacillus atrophaeus]MBU5263507.1 hypothetical protein [Bacillus atrophaeus]
MKNGKNEKFSAGFQFIIIKNDNDEIPLPLMICILHKPKRKMENFRLWYFLMVTEVHRLLYRTISQFLARNGCIAVIPQHPFNNRDDNTSFKGMVL